MLRALPQGEHSGVREAGFGASWFEQLDWVAGWILDNGLPSAYTLDHVATEVNFDLAWLRTYRRDVVDLNGEAVPAARFRYATVGQNRASAGIRTAGCAQYQAKISPRQHGEGLCWVHVLVEAQVLGVERDGR